MATIASDSRPVPSEQRLDRRTVAALFVVIGALCAVHVTYLALSRMIPSEDEVHYMTGAISIADGIRSGTLSGVWNGYRNALGFKAPLVCVPAAILLLRSNDTIRACMFSLVPTFAALGLVSFRLFRRCVGDWRALAATTVLLSTPMITGLSHNFYVELLLVTVAIWYVDLLAARPWSRPGAAAVVGLAAGLGVLTKSSFPGLVALPTIFSLIVEIVDQPAGRAGRALMVARNWTIAVVVAMAVGGPWYLYNLANVLRHAEASLALQTFYDRSWIQVDLSSGPGALVALVAAIACPLAVRDLAMRRTKGPRREALVLVLLLGLNTAAAVAGTVNKATRFVVTGLPAIALLSIMLWDCFRWPSIKRYGPGLLAAWGLLLSWQISFGIPRLRPVRIGAMSILDSNFTLNSADMSDSHPLDRRDFHLDAIDDLIASDAAKRFPPRQLIRIRLASEGLLSNFYYLRLVNELNHREFDYAEWRGSVTNGAEAPEYIVGYDGFERIYPMVDHYPGLREDVAAGKIGYVPAGVIEAPENTRILVYAKKVATPTAPLELNLAAMTRSATPPLYNLEKLADVASPLGQRQPVEVRASGNLTLEGWAVDRDAVALAGGVDVVIDGKSHAALYGRSRPDVAAYFKVPAYQNAGFSASVPFAAIGPGPHKLAIRVIAQDRRSYREGAVIELEVR